MKISILSPSTNIKSLPKDTYVEVIDRGINKKWYTGYVITAYCYKPDGWFIEMTDVNHKGYRYWKQGPDGGDLFVDDEVINKLV